MFYNIQKPFFDTSKFNINKSYYDENTPTHGHRWVPELFLGNFASSLPWLLCRDDRVGVSTFTYFEIVLENRWDNSFLVWGLDNWLTIAWIAVLDIIQISSTRHHLGLIEFTLCTYFDMVLFVVRGAGSYFLIFSALFMERNCKCSGHFRFWLFFRNMKFLLSLTLNVHT